MNPLRAVPVALAAWGVISSLFLPWLQVKPNRIVEGTGRVLFPDDPIAGALFLLLWLFPLVFLLRRPPRAGVVAAWLACLVAPVVLLFAAGLTATPLVPLGSFARVSPTWAFWGTLLFAYGGSLVLGPHSGLPRSVTTVAAFTFPVALVIALATGVLGSLSLLKEYSAQTDVFWADVVQHLQLSGIAVAAGSALGLLVGWGSFRLVRFRRASFFVLNLVQTLPSLALFGLLIVPMAALGVGGIGMAPALVALSLYAAFPIARSTLTALDHLDAAVIDAGKGLGMTRGQLLARVQVPLALPVVLAGVRMASVQTVGNTVVAALIGAGGLGSLVFSGLGQFAPDLILLGALPVVALALGLDLLWAGGLRLLPLGIRL